MRIEIKNTLVETVQVFLKYIGLYGGSFFEWYVGLTTDPKRSYLDVHGVDLLKEDWMISEECSVYIADFIIKFLTSVGCVHFPDKDIRGESIRVYVYLYRMKKRDELFDLY